MMFVWLAGCTLNATPTPSPQTATPALTPVPAATPAPFGDAASVVSGICFEAAFDAAGRVFVLRSADDLTHFYNDADNSRLCRRPVAREPFDFSEGRVVAGLWSYGMGCTAQHEVVAFERDDSAQRITVRLAFSTQGDCPYELIRPFWIVLEDAAGYEISIETVEPA